MTTQTVVSNEDIVFWQSERSEDEPIPEPAILIKEFSDILCIQQDDSEINITKSKKNLLALSKIFKDKANSSNV